MSIVTIWSVFLNPVTYTGKSLESPIEAGLFSRVLLELITGLDGHQLYTDNYYTSPAVYLELYENG